MGALGAGLLGFVAGAAKGGLAVQERELDAADERRRMFAEEMKQRRMAEFNMDLKSREETRRLAAIDPKFWEEHPLARQIGALGGPTAVSSLMAGDYASEREKAEQIEAEERALQTTLDREARAEKRQLEQEARTPLAQSPGTTYSTRAEVQERMKEGGGSYQVPFRPPTTREQVSALNEVFKQADSTIDLGAVKYNSTYENRLLTATLDEIQQDEDKAVAFQALITDVARGSVESSIRDQVKADPEAINSLTSDVVVEQVRSQEQAIQEALQGTMERYANALKQSGITDDTQKRDFVRKLINEGYKDAEGNVYNPAEIMKKHYMWSPAFANIIINTLAYSTPQGQQAPIFQIQ